MHNKKNDLFRRFEEMPSRLYIFFGTLLMALFTALCVYTEVSVTLLGFSFILLYAVSCTLVFLFSRRRRLLFRSENAAEEAQSEGVIAAFRDSLTLPYAVITEGGRIVAVNAAMREAFPLRDTFYQLPIAELCSLPIDGILRDASYRLQREEQSEGDSDTVHRTPVITAIGDRSYTVDCYPVHSRGQLFYMLVFHDVTEHQALIRLHEATTPVVAYIVLDNLEQIAQYVKGSYRTEAVKVEGILKQFAKSLHGVIREYDRDKYLLLLTKEALSSCIKNKFEILDEIRDVRIGDDSIPLTVSIGIAATGDTLAEREHDALAALDTALQRGGDQVVLRNEQGVFYFGGRTKGQQKRTAGHARVVASKLCSMICAASNVVVMGHANPDFDCIGACVGIATLAHYVGVPVRIVTNRHHESFKSCTAQLCESEDYRNVFVDGVQALSECSFSTLVIIVDANNFAILEAPEIAKKSFKTVVIDHHIKKEDFEVEPEIVYIDPSASSASEMVSEMLEQTLPAGVLRKEEANVLLAGIMLDTKNFTRNVGTRTFSAALHLRSAGASTEVCRTFFEEAFDDYRAEAIFGARVEMYRDRIAITTSEGTDSPHDRVAAAKAADKLLTVRQVNAAFALVRVGENIHISARSDGTVNVQLILEKIGGGGHFDMAGAALADRSVEEAKRLLCEAIDEYFEPNKRKSAEA